MHYRLNDALRRVRVGLLSAGLSGLLSVILLSAWHRPVPASLPVAACSLIDVRSDSAVAFLQIGADTASAPGRMHAGFLYDYHLKEKEIAALRLQHVRNRQTLRLFAVAGLLAILSFACYWRYNKRKCFQLEMRWLDVKRIQHEAECQSAASMEKCKAYIGKLEAELEAIRLTHQREQASLWEKLQAAQERCRILELQLSSKLELCTQTDQPLTALSIVRRLSKKARSPQGVANVSASEWKLLKSWISLCYPDFFTKLDSLCYRFKEKEVCMNMLIKAGFAPSEIAVLLGHPVQTITTMRRRLSQSALEHFRPTPQQWDDFINSL